MSKFLAGVDAGGSRTRAVVAGADLVPRGRGASGPANAATTPIPRVVEAIAEAVDDALASAGASRADLRGVSCGVAGVEGPGNRGRLLAALETEFGQGRVRLASDMRIALAGALAGPVDSAGVVLISGTGAVAFGRNSDGLEARAGGWGPLIGDEGSGFEIGRRALAAIVRDVDGRGPRTLMRESLFASEGTRSPVELLGKLYRAGAAPADVAAYFPLALDAARKGDAIALAILHDAGKELGLAAVTVLRKLGLAQSSVEVATVGGVFNAGEPVTAPLRETLFASAPGVRLVRPARPPEIGAIRLALAEFGADE